MRGTTQVLKDGVVTVIGVNINQVGHNFMSGHNLQALDRGQLQGYHAVTITPVHRQKTFVKPRQHVATRGLLVVFDAPLTVVNRNHGGACGMIGDESSGHSQP